MDEEKDIILKFDAVRKTYRGKGSFLKSSGREVVALSALSLEIFRGEIFGLVGESGSGKTTAGRLIVRLEDPDRGRITLDGEEITRLKGRDLKAFRRKVQMIFQDPYQSLNAQVSVFDAVSEPLVIHRIGDREGRKQATAQVLKAAGLSPPEDFFTRFPHELSGGQRQRVAIARAMILSPEFVVADEPTSMLDASISAQIFNVLIGMRAELGATLLFITHSLAAARYLCDRIGVIYRGHLMEVGPAEDIIAHPRHPYTQALLDALPKFGQCGEDRPYGTLLKGVREVAEEAGCAFFDRCAVAQRLRCSRERPELRSVAPGHRVACFYVQTATEPNDRSAACYYGT
jgi:peptide/nickel transport system ATP-binding protein